MPLKINKTYTEQSAIDLVGEGSSVKRVQRDGCFALTNKQIGTFLELGSAGDTQFTTAFELKWKGVLPSIVSTKKGPRPIHGFVKSGAGDQFTYIGPLSCAWRCESKKQGESYTNFQLDSPVTKKLAARLGISSRVEPSINFRNDSWRQTKTLLLRRIN